MSVKPIALPVINLSNSPENIQNLRAACEDIGFFYLAHHGISPCQMTDIYRVMADFFALPFEKKNQSNLLNSSSGTRGYFALKQEDLNGKDSTRDLGAENEVVDAYEGDYKEGFDVGYEFDDDYIQSHEHPLVVPNQWPDVPSDLAFKSVVMDYQKSLLTVSYQLLEMFALSLNLNTAFFVEKCQRPQLTLRMLRYPGQSLDSASLGAGAHTDYGFFTLLAQDEIGGLQVRTKTGAWVDVMPRSDCFVVNIGDMMSRWTHSRYSSTVHRVISASEKDRYSIPFFFNPDVDAEVAVLPQCLSEGEREKWPPETAGDILLQRYAGTMKKTV